MIASRCRAVAALGLLALPALIAGCGGDSKSAKPGTQATTPAATQATTPAPTATQPAATPVPKGPVPASLRSAESAAEDLIDAALAGGRSEVVANADELARVASGSLRSALRTSGVGAAEIAEFQRRAARVKRLAPTAPLVDVALASNHAFQLLPDFFARFKLDVPADVTRLDYLDFEAKLESKAGNAAKLGAAVRGLSGVWTPLRGRVIKAGGATPAAAYDAHLEAMRGLSDNARPKATQQEAQHGLDLVDDIERVFAP